MKISFVKCQDMRKHTTLLVTIFPKQFSFRRIQFYLEDGDFFFNNQFWTQHLIVFCNNQHFSQFTSKQTLLSLHMQCTESNKYV